MKLGSITVAVTYKISPEVNHRVNVDINDFAINFNVHDSQTCLGLRISIIRVAGNLIIDHIVLS
jgi:hypothetical protein